MTDSPYESPLTDITAPPTLQTITSSPYGSYRDLRGIAKALLALLVLLGLLELVAVGAALFSISEIQSASTDKQLDQLDSINQGITLFFTLIFLITAVVWCVWTNKSCKNAWFFNAQSGVRPATEVFKPGWAVGYYFIPLVNLWRPMQAMVFIRDAITKHTGSVGTIVGWWWFFWILSNIFSKVTDRIYTENTLEAYIGNQNLIIYLSPIDVASTISAFILVKRITRAQTESAIAHGVITNSAMIPSTQIQVIS